MYIQLYHWPPRPAPARARYQQRRSRLCQEASSLYLLCKCLGSFDGPPRTKQQATADTTARAYLPWSPYRTEEKAAVDGRRGSCLRALCPRARELDDRTELLQLGCIENLERSIWGGRQGAQHAKVYRSGGGMRDAQLKIQKS